MSSKGKKNDRRNRKRKIQDIRNPIELITDDQQSNRRVKAEIMQGLFDDEDNISIASNQSANDPNFSAVSCENCLSMANEISGLKEEFRDFMERQAKETSEIKRLLKKIAEKFFMVEPETAEFAHDFPIKTVEDLELFEKNLEQDKAIQTKFVDYVRSVKGKQPLKTVFPLIVSASVACKYNWDGKKGQMPFKNLTFFNEAVFDAFKTESFAFLDFIDEIRHCLKAAKLKIAFNNFKSRHSL